jgi:predicted transcriptional regulator
MNSRRALVLAIHPEHAESILSGEKTFEVRSRLPRLPFGTRVYLYATSPVSAVIGGFEAGVVLEASAESIWEQVGRALGVSKEAFEKYVRGRQRIKAVQVLNPFRLNRSVPRTELTSGPNPYSPPQSSSFLRNTGLQLHLESLLA